MDSFNISYFSVVLVAEFYIIHIQKFTTFTIQSFFSLRYILCVAVTSKKHNNNIKRGSPFLFHHKKTSKGQFWLQMTFSRKGTGVSFEKTPFYPCRVSKIAIKTILTTKGAFFTSFYATSEMHCHL